MWAFEDACSTKSLVFRNSNIVSYVSFLTKKPFAKKN
jgi:hypothetical protein